MTCLTPVLKRIVLFALLSAFELAGKCNPTATRKLLLKATLLGMTNPIENMRLSAQETLDELYSESLIPFELSARVVEYIGLEEYIIRFHDSRLRSVDVSWHEGSSFKEGVRRAVLDRVSRIIGPPKVMRAA